MTMIYFNHQGERQPPRSRTMTNRELAKSIWAVIRTELDFEAWFKDCFRECVEDAVKLINTGCCTFKNGSVLEISRTISKDGKTHNFDFDKENFIEFYGEESCFKQFTTTDDIVNDLINYAAGSGKSDFYNEEQSELFAEFDSEWQKLPCDSEGANSTQKKEQDELLEEYAEKILDLM